MIIRPLVSVILPVYNGELFLSETLESILNQSFSDFEIIAIDDGSIDGSIKILKEYAKKDDRISILSNSKNMGIAKTTNFGISQAKGIYIALSDQDDVSLPERFQLQVEYLNTHPKIDLVSAQVKRVDSEGNQLKVSSNPLSPGALRWGLLFGCVLTNPVVMMKKKIFSDHGYQYGPAKTAQDFEFFTRISPSYKMVNLPQTLLIHREHDQNTSKHWFENQQHESYDIIRKQVLDLIGENLPDHLISGIMNAKYQKKQREITSPKTAWEVSHVLTKLMKKAMQWNITAEDRNYIKQNTASRLRRIWQEQNYHPFLLPFIFYFFPD